MACRCQDLRRATQFIGAKLREECFDGSAAGRAAKITPCALGAVLQNFQFVGRRIEPGAKTREPGVFHQHQEALLGQIGGCGRIKAAGAVLDRIAPVARNGARPKRRRGELLGGEALHRIAIDGAQDGGIGHSAV